MSSAWTLPACPPHHLRRIVRGTAAETFCNADIFEKEIDRVYRMPIGASDRPVRFTIEGIVSALSEDARFPARSISRTGLFLT